MVTEDEELDSQHTALTCQVPTRWNSDLECLLAHMHFKNIVEQLTAISSLKLTAYGLSEDQWKIADDVCQVLLVFNLLYLIIYSSYIQLAF